jgi:hypothetical protein
MRWSLLAVLLLCPAGVSVQVLPNDIPDVLANCPNLVPVGQSQTIATPVTLDCLAVKGTVTLTAKLSVGTIRHRTPSNTGPAF